METVAPENPFVLTVSLWVHCSGMQLLDGESRDMMAKRAAEIDERLAEETSYRLGQSLRGEYYFHVHDLPRAINALRLSGIWPDALATILYATGEFDAAVDVYPDEKQQQSAAFRMKRAIFEIEAGEVERHQRQLEAWHESGDSWFEMAPNDVGSQTIALEYALRLGRLEIAQTKAHELYNLLKKDESIGYHMTPTQLILEYLIDAKEEPELLEATAHSRELTQNAYFWIALRRLSEGNKTAFEQALQQLEPSKCYMIYSSLWGWAMRQQLEADTPKWPGWLAAIDR